MAQQSTKSTVKPADNNDAAVRQTATLLLESVIVELREVEDFRARISMATTIVKLLGKSRPDQCRSMLDSLFQAALQLRNSESVNKDANLGTESMLQAIIRISAQLDPKLAKTYIEKYKEEKETPAPGQEASSQSPIATLYMNLALQMVEKDLPFAMSMAKRSVNITIVPETLVLLATLRRNHVAQANTVFIWALESVTRRQGNDVNELLLLYSYVFSPLRVPVVSAQGIGMLSVPGYLPNGSSYDADPALAKKYLSTVTDLLLDAERYYSRNMNRLVEGVAGDYYLLSLLTVAAGNYLPAVTQSLVTEQNILAGYLQPDARTQASSSLERWNTMPTSVAPGVKETPATIEYLLQRAEEVKDQRRKDQLYYRAAVVEAGINPEAAFAITDKISPEYRKDAKEFIAFDLAIKAARNFNMEYSERLGRADDDLTRRSFIFTLIANSLIEKNRDLAHAMELFNEIEQSAAKLESVSERVAVLGGAAAVASRLDAARAADLLRAAIRNTSKIEGFTIDMRVARNLDIGGFLFVYSMYDKEFTLGEAISRLGAIDFHQTIADVRGFKDRLPRLQATVLVCNSVISKASSLEPAPARIVSAHEFAAYLPQSQR